MKGKRGEREGARTNLEAKLAGGRFPRVTDKKAAKRKNRLRVNVKRERQSTGSQVGEGASQ